MKLTKTNSGNWAKEVTITGGGKWRKCTMNNVPAEVAETYAEVQRSKGRKTEIRPANPCKDGQPGFQVWAYFGKNKVVMQHASAEECIAAGVEPGPCNNKSGGE